VVFSTLPFALRGSAAANTNMFARPTQQIATEPPFDG
jgi:hypothetical protein